MVAQMKRSVVAVDPIKENLAYIRQSVTRAGNQNYVQYVARPVRYQQPNFPKTSLGSL